MTDGGNESGKCCTSLKFLSYKGSISVNRYRRSDTHTRTRSSKMKENHVSREHFSQFLFTKKNNRKKKRKSRKGKQMLNIAFRARRSGRNVARARENRHAHAHGRTRTDARTDTLTHTRMHAREMTLDIIHGMRRCISSSEFVYCLTSFSQFLANGCSFLL